MTAHTALATAAASAALLGLSACQTMDVLSDLGADVAVATGAATEEQGASIRRAGTAVGKTFESITPEQEYYIGRTVGAVLLSRYPPLNDEGLNRYLNTLGQLLAQFSDRPETFGGYRFLVLDSGDINAFAAPGGLIFVSRGMLRCCETEDALAAVLAHEIGHVQLQHGLRAIRTSRLTSAFTILAAESAKSFGGRDLAGLTEAFEGSVSDITGTLMNSGYSRAFERQADQSAVTILERAGYDPQGLVAMLAAMRAQLKPGGLDFAKTHPPPVSRIADLAKTIGPARPVATAPARQDRFDRVRRRL